MEFYFKFTINFRASAFNLSPLDAPHSEFNPCIDPIKEHRIVHASAPPRDLRFLLNSSAASSLYLMTTFPTQGHVHFSHFPYTACLLFARENWVETNKSESWSSFMTSLPRHQTSSSLLVPKWDRIRCWWKGPIVVVSLHQWLDQKLNSSNKKFPLVL